MLTGINELKTLTKHVLCLYKCEFNGRKCGSDQKWNNNKCRCQCQNQKKKHHPCVKYYIWNPAICSCKTGKYLASIIDNSIITCGEIIYTTKNVPTKSVLEKSISVNLYILLSLLLVTIAIISIIYSVALQLNEVLY